MVQTPQIAALPGMTPLGFRAITLAQAKAQYVHRFTMEHVPAWANEPHLNHDNNTFKYYAPQYKSDKEWYDNTVFPGESDLCIKSDDHCYSSGKTWPLGQWLDKPYKKQA